MSGQKKRKGLGSLGVDVLLSTPVQEVSILNLPTKILLA